MQSNLAGSGGRQESRQVGAPIVLNLDPARYLPEIRFRSPGTSETDAISVDATPTADGLAATLAEITTAGFFTAELTTNANQEETRRFAVNVDPEEGDLATVDREHLAARLPGVSYEYRSAADFQVAVRELAGSNISDWILYLLVGILVGEQLLAYSASYHTRAIGSTR
jgi:hypothetical protein